MTSIKSKDCSASSIKSLLKVAFAQLSNSAADSADSGGEDEEEGNEGGKGPSLRQIALLAQKYNYCIRGGV